MRDEQITVEEAAKLCGKSRQAIYDLLRSGKLVPVNYGVPVRLSKRALLRIKFGRKVPRRLVDVDTVAKRFNVSASAIRHHILRGTLKPGFRISGKWYFDPKLLVGFKLPNVGRPKRGV